MRVNFGDRVKLTLEFVREDPLIPLIKAATRDTLGVSMESHIFGISVARDVPESIVIPKGSKGTVRLGPYLSASDFDLARETPVSFDLFSKGSGIKGVASEFVIGIPDELLKVITEVVRS